MIILLLASVFAFQTRVEAPEKAISKYSLSVVVPEKKQFTDWSEEDHCDSYKTQQKIVRYWKQQQFADQFLIYGKVSKNEDFRWEVVPQFDCNYLITRFTQQCKTLWGATFPVKSNGVYDVEWSGEEEDEYELFASDPFCDREVIEKQWVYKGELINVLYNYRPIGFGDEKLHFLVLPKNHRPTFYQLSEEEYQESLIVVQKLLQHFSQTRSIYEAHLFHKSGKDAGQTVPHWHLHVVLTTSDWHTCLGKFSVLRNMLFTPSPLGDEELKTKVEKYRGEIIPALQY
ncbi:MAG: hypothetical protein ChlgKO_12440 [Chlamydiales bacterium]